MKDFWESEAFEKWLYLATGHRDVKIPEKTHNYNDIITPKYYYNLPQSGILK